MHVSLYMQAQEEKAAAEEAAQKLKGEQAEEEAARLQQRMSKQKSPAGESVGHAPIITPSAHSPSSASRTHSSSVR